MTSSLKSRVSGISLLIVITGLIMSCAHYQAPPDQVILFTQGSSQPGPDAIRYLQELSVFLKHRRGYRVVVEGHTDNIEEKNVAYQLSKDRAQAISKILTRNEIEADRIEAVAYGAYKPVASNETQQGKSRNRRASIVLYKTDKSFFSRIFDR